MAGIYFKKTVRIAVLLAAAAGLLWTIIFAVFYVSSTYESSASRYLQLNGYCFYRLPFWQRDFFTPAVKAAGNRHCILAILVAITFLAGGLRCWQSRMPPLTQSSIFKDKTRLRIIGVLLLACCGLWYWGYHTIGPAFDEVFSAINCAGMHPVGTLSYYMLPNNHVLFNTLNRVAFFWADNKLVTGRIIAGAFYAATAPVMYWLVLQLTARRWVAGAITLLLLLHFPVWGFGFQGRGYAMYTFFGWAAMAAYHYHCTRPSIWALRIVAACAVAGFATVPTFLYLLLLIMTLEAARSLYRGQIAFRFWRHMAMIAAATYLFYLPAICMSGIGHLLNAAPRANTSFHKFATDVFDLMREGFQHCFSYWTGDRNPLALWLMFVPLLLLFSNRRNGLERKIGIGYILLWASFTAYVLWDHRFPFMRNMALHFSLTLAAVALTFWWYIEALAARLRRGYFKLTIIPILALFAAHFWKYNATKTSLCLYFYDVNPRYEILLGGLQALPPGSSIGLSEEGFYWEHLARIKQYRPVKCPSGTEDYYIMQNQEPRPAWLQGAYEEQKPVSDFLIFRRRR